MEIVPDNIGWEPTGRTLGKGGQGTVIEVVRRDDPSRRAFAMKILADGHSRAAYQRFYRELEAVAKIDSAYVCHVVDHSPQDAQFHYYVMDLHEGAKSLQELLRTSNNPYHDNAARALDLFEQLMRAVEVYARQDIVHRDLSPANTLILRDGTIRIIDFGICQMEDGAAVTLADENLGTRNYAPPECETGSTESITIHADLYSAGKILWAAVTNRFAFAREAPAFSGHAIGRMLPGNASAQHLQELISKTIRRNPSDRFQSAAQALAAVDSVRNLINYNRLPLELALQFCPICGRQNVKATPNLHGFFANPQQEGYDNIQCTACGYTAVVNLAIWKKNFDRLYPPGEA